MPEQKVAVVTGSGRRLGRQMALALAKRGFDLVIAYRNSESGAKETSNEASALGHDSIVVQADISRPDDVERLVRQSVAKYKKIDVLVNNAGIFLRRTWNQINFETWQSFLATNLTGAFLCSQAFGRGMVKQGCGRIVNIASIGGIQAWANHIPYSVSKSGVISLTRCFARALAPSVMVNSIAPGTIIIEGEEDPSVQHLPVERIPLQRYGMASDVISVLLFLATSASYITGQVFAVDGGRSIDFHTS
jgi:3-oxoacyl-[acyl-carrier protein] reductase